MTFTNPVEASERGDLVRFKIKPPIAVYDPKFLERAVLDDPRNASVGGDFDLIEGVNLTYSDEAATHGTVKTYIGEHKTLFEEVVTDAFTSELGLGNVALNFSFTEQDPHI